MAKRKKEYTTEELVDMEVFTLKEAQTYVEEKLKMGPGLFRDCIRPELNPKPIGRNYREKKPAHLVVTKASVDKVIARHKKKLLE